MLEFDIDDIIDQIMGSLGENGCDFRDIVFFENMSEREIFLADINDNTGFNIDSLIRFWNRQDEGIDPKKRKPIKVIINSGGGDLVNTFTVIDAITFSITPVWTINTGMAYSGGFFIFLAGHKRFAYPNSSFLFHEGSTATSADAGKFRNYSEFYQTQLDKLKDFVLKNSEIDEDLYNQHIKDDWWMIAEEAKKYGVCDEIMKEGIY